MAKTERTEAWLAEEPDVRLYSVTGGRTEPNHSMSAESVFIVGDGPLPDRLGPEARQAVGLCRHEERSVAEIAGVLRLPVQVTAIILSDLIDSGSLLMAASRVAYTADPEVLKKLLTGLKRWANAA